MSSSLGRLGSSVAAATARRRSAAGLQQSTSYSAIHKLETTSPTTVTATPTVSRLSVLVNRTPFSRHFVGRGSASNGSSCGLLRPPRAALAQTTPPQQLAPYTSRSCAAPFAAITTRAFTAHSSSGGFTPSRCNLRQSSPPPSSLLLPQLLVQQQHRYKWDYQEQRRMMSATGGAGDPGAGPRAGAAGAGGAGQQQKAEGENQEPPEAEEEDDEKLGAKGVLQLIAFGVILCVVFVCGYFITMELMPSRMSPNTVMNKAHDAFLADPDTANHFGTPLKAYGRDNQRHREGRRNFVEHEEYEEKADGSKRTRVKFNVEGPHGHGMAYAEVSNKMGSGEWVYLCVQDMQTGHVITLQDNRAMLAAQAQASSSAEKDAFAAMLGKRS